MVALQGPLHWIEADSAEFAELALPAILRATAMYAARAAPRASRTISHTIQRGSIAPIAGTARKPANGGTLRRVKSKKPTASAVRSATSREIPPFPPLASDAKSAEAAYAGSAERGPHSEVTRIKHQHRTLRLVRLAPLRKSRLRRGQTCRGGV
jgi:hypothetical protein